MLYLEDYLEMIEHLPQELRDRFTDMREMDLSVQNAIDILEKRVKIFFSNAKRLGKLEKDMEHESIRRDYYKTLEDADEKVQLANHMYELVDRYLRRLDSELFKFKIELEADNSGITEILEKRSLELDLPPMNSVNREKENRYSFGSRSSGSHGKQKKRRDSSAVGSEKRPSGDKSSGGHSHSHSHSHSSHGHSHGSHGHSHGSHGHSHSSHGHSHSSHGHSHRDGHRDSHSHRENHNVHRDSHGQAHRESQSYTTNHIHPSPSQLHSQSQALSQSPQLVMGSVPSVTTMDMRPGSAGSVTPTAHQQSAGSAAALSGGVSYSLGHIGAGGNAIAAAASQAIAATQQGFLKPVSVKVKKVSESIKKLEGGGVFFPKPAGAPKSVKVKKVSENCKKVEGNLLFSQKLGGTKPQDAKEGTIKTVKPKKAPMTCKKAFEGNSPFFHKSPGNKSVGTKEGTVKSVKAKKMSENSKKVEGIAAFYQNLDGNKPLDTKEMQQGRRTASLKASYEAINIAGGHSHDFTVGREIAGAAQTALAAIHDVPKKKKKSSSSASQAAAAAAAAAAATAAAAAAAAAAMVPLSSSTSSLAMQPVASHPLVDEGVSVSREVLDDSVLDPNADGVDGENVDWTYDPNEPRYCLCNQVSYGDMVACDNEDCPFEWFHYPCVGITASPKGKWYCPQCSSAMKRRGRKN